MLAMLLISLVVAIGLSAAYYWCCARKISAVNAEIDSALKILSTVKDFNDINAELDKTKLLAPMWKNFRGTLTQTRDGIFSSTDAAEFFSPQNFTRGMNMTFWQSYGGIFTGLGILFTFGGLVYGLSGLDMTSGDIETLKDGIADLLKGVETAFVTSLVGIGAAFVYSWVHHWLMKDFHANVQALANALDKKFLCKTAETWLAENLQETRDQTTTLQSAEEWLAKNLHESHDQTTTLQNSETLLANNLQETRNQTTTLQNSQTLLAKNLQEAQSQTVSLQNIGETVTEAIHNGLDEKLDELTEKICTALENIGHEAIGKALSDNAGPQIKSFSAALEKFSNDIDEKLRNADKISESMNTQLSETLKNLRETLANDAKISAEEREKSAQKFFEITDALTESLKVFTAENSAQISEVVKTFLEIVDRHNQTTQDLFTRIQNLLSATEKFLSRVNEAGNSLTQAATPVKQSSELLSQHLNKTTQAAEKFRNELAERMKDLAEENKTTRENLLVLSMVVKNFRGIADELERSTKIIHDSLDGYNTTMSKELAIALKNFDESMNAALNGLDGAITDFSEVVGYVKQQQKRR